MDSDAAPAGDPGDGPTAAPAPSGPADAGPATGGGGRLTGGEAARTHVVLVVGLALCAVAFWFELRRALGGNGLSWAYVFEWPLFAVFAVYMWWNVLHGGRVRRTRPARPQPALDPKYAGMLEAWEAHQRELQASVAATEGDAGRNGPPERATGVPEAD